MLDVNYSTSIILVSVIMKIEPKHIITERIAS